MSHIRGRFQKKADKAVVEYTASIPFDWQLYPYDIAGSIAHAKMLAKQGIISDKEAETIINGLAAIKDEIKQGKFKFKPELEDIHMNIEDILYQRIGDVAGKLHTARSRNDQIALDMRLFIKDAIQSVLNKLNELQKSILDIAEDNKEVILPGYTHLQRAQPVLLAHHLLAYFEMFERDKSRFNNCLVHSDVLPLGSGALAGVPYDIDRNYLASELGFSEISANSIDAVSDRDFIIEFESASAISIMHLSRLVEEIIIWSSSEFSFIDIDEAYATTSSIMPQKKNPDVAELIRAKTGRVYGNLVGFLTVMKGLPLSYNRDLQEDKELLFDTVDTLVSSLEVCCGLVKTLKPRPDTMYKAASDDYILATDLADYLTKKGIPS